MGTYRPGVRPGVVVLRPRRPQRGLLGPRYRRWKVRWRPRVMLLCHIGGAAALAQLLAQVGMFLLGSPRRWGW